MCILALFEGDLDTAALQAAAVIAAPLITIGSVILLAWSHIAADE